MVRIVACTIATLCVLTTPAKAEPPARVLTKGFGSESSCGEWLHEGLRQGSNWILGIGRGAMWQVVYCTKSVQQPTMKESSKR